MNKDESVKKVQLILAQMNFSRDDLFKEMSNSMKIKPFKKLHLISNSGLAFSLFFMGYMLFMMFTGQKSQSTFIFPLLFVSTFLVNFFYIIYFKDFSLHNFQGLSFKKNFFQYIKYLKSELHVNNCYNKKAKDKISLNIYKKISEHITQEELENILSYNLTYEDLGLKDFSLKSSEEHQMFEEAKSNHKKIMAEYNKNEEIKKQNSLNTTTKQLAASLKENNKS